MNLRYIFHQLSLQLMLSVVAISATVETAAAGKLTIKIRQNQYATATLKHSTPTNESVRCPRHFKSVLLSGDIDLENVATVYARPEFSIHQRASENDKPSANSLATGHIQLHLFGCVFGKHFLPQEGHVTLSLNLESGLNSSRSIRYSPDHGFNDLRLNYTALLTGRVIARFSPFKEETFLIGNKTLGTLTLRFPREELSITGAQSNSEALLENFDLELILLADDKNR